jgi:hypothetical protein
MLSERKSAEKFMCRQTQINGIKTHMAILRTVNKI